MSNTLIFTVFRILGNASDVCCLCLKFLAWGQVACRADAKIAHYKCAKKWGWKRQSRAKKVGRKHQPKVQSKVIKVLRKGTVIKTITSEY